MAALFGHGNPLATPVGQLIERATDGAQATENWGLFMEVCDLINETDEGPKDACKAFKKRLSQNVGKNFTAVMYTLTCLETCVKNCARRFHQHVASKDFLQELVKVIGPKHDPPQTVQEKVLQIIQTWADAFRGVPELKEVEKTYQELKSKGIEFPMTDLDNMAPIHTPARTVPYRPPERIAADPASAARPPHLQQQQPTQGGLPVRGGAPTNPPPPIPGTVPVTGTGTGTGTPGYPVSLSPEQRTKLTRELDVVQGNCRVMNEMLTELSPSNVDVSDWELLQELNRTCRQMRQRIRELLGEVANEDVTNELLRVNDDLNNVFLRYERFERYVSGQTVPETSEPSPALDHLPPSYDQVCTPKDEGTRLPAQINPNVGNLIDLDEPAAASQMAGLNLTNNVPAPVPVSTAAAGTAGDEEFDMFAQSRQSFDQNRQATGPIYSNQKEDQMAGGLGQAVNVKSQSDQDVLNLQEKETDYDEMEQWLATHDPNAAALLKELEDEENESESGARPEGLTSSEFDRFLIERASAAESVPTIPAQTGQQSAARNTRQLKKDEEDTSLFAL